MGIWLISFLTHIFKPCRSNQSPILCSHRCRKAGVYPVSLRDWKGSRGVTCPFRSRKQYSDKDSSPDSEDDTVTVTGLMQAIISVFADNGDKIRFINSGGKRITFVQRPPLYLVCVSSAHEPVSVVSVNQFFNSCILNPLFH